MLFHNHIQESDTPNVTHSMREEPTSTRACKLESTLPCQEVINVRRGHKRGSIPADYISSTENTLKSGSRSTTKYGHLLER